MAIRPPLYDDRQKFNYSEANGFDIIEKLVDLSGKSDFSAPLTPKSAPF
ncbi:MAG: hypothetical protein F6K17_04910 [Okeania sp. SIO3C4]|nr:hypothetical protein [Okeania sp. SIO3C4]